MSKANQMNSVKTDYVQTTEQVKWTFELSEIRQWVEGHLSGTVLNACCGPSKLNHGGKIIRNDIDPDTDADYHLDAVLLPSQLAAESVDTIVFDPPWSMYQANMRYDGNHVRKGEVEISIDSLPQEIKRGKSQVGHARLAKDGFDYLLKPGGKVIQLSYNGTCMPRRLQYQRLERVMFDPIGEAKTLIGSVDEKVQQKL